MYERHQIISLRERLDEPPKLMTVVSGPRQVGKSTLVRQALGQGRSLFAATDHPLPDIAEPYPQETGSTAPIPGSAPTAEWIIQRWSKARAMATIAREKKNNEYVVLALDEIQKIPRWSEVIKGLWDADRIEGMPLHVILLGSSPWLVQKGLTESLAGRYEPIHLTHWSYPEMQAGFDFSLDEFIYFGGYPGAAEFRRNEGRWRSYIRDAMILSYIEKDVLQMTRVDRPALLKSLFELGCGYSSQIVSLTKLLGQAKDARHTVTMADYLHLLSQAGLLTGLQKYSGALHRQRASPPKFAAHNTALISALGSYTFAEAKADRSYWGRLVESAIGAHLVNTASDRCAVQYWREGADEVDFVLSRGNKIMAIEVKSGARFAPPKGLAVFTAKYPQARQMVVGEGGISLPEFLSQPADTWVE